MGTVLVTVAGPTSRMDLSLPTDAAWGARTGSGGALRARTKPWSRWALGPAEGAPFAPRQTLAELGVVEGRSCNCATWSPAATPGVSRWTRARGSGGGGRPAAAEDLRPDRAVDRRHRPPPRRKNPLLEYAAPEARRCLRALFRALRPRGEWCASDLSLAVSWHRDPRAPVEALAGFTEIAADAGGPGAHDASPLQRDAGPAGERQDDRRRSLPPPSRRQRRRRPAATLTRW